MTREQQFEVAVKSPETISETAEEVDLRIKAEQLYYNSGGRARSGIGGYEAGWKAAKAWYDYDPDALTGCADDIEYELSAALRNISPERLNRLLAGLK